MIDLGIEFCGLRFKNPVVPASSDLAQDALTVKRCIEAGAGGIITKTVTSVASRRGRAVPGRWQVNLINPKMGVQLPGWPGLSQLTPEQWAQGEMAKVKKLCQEAEIPLVVSIMGDDPDDWAKLAVLMEELGADMLELNLSCPVCAWGKKGLERTLAADAEAASEVVQAVKKAVRIPVMPKMSPLLVSGMGEVARALEQAGADALAGFNGTRGLFIDVELEEPYALPFVVGYSPGRAFKAQALGAMGQVVLNVSPDLPLAGCGGIYEGNDALEFILVGCSLTQIGKAAYILGIGVIGKVIKGIAHFMEKKGYQGIEEFRGKVRSQLIFPSEYPSVVQPFGQPLEVCPWISQEKCDLCGICIKRCPYGALRAEQPKFLAFDSSKCDSCGTCVSVCPRDAIWLADSQGNVIWRGRGLARPWPLREKLT